MRTIGIFSTGFFPPLVGFAIHPILGVAVIFIQSLIVVFWFEIFEILDKWRKL